MLAIRNVAALFLIRIKNWSIYRFDMVLAVMGMVIPIIGLTLYWTDILQQSSLISGSMIFTKKTIILYYIIAFVVELLFSYEIAFSVEEDISTGKMNGYFMLPCGYLTVKLSEYLSKNFFSCCLLLTLAAVMKLAGIVPVSLVSVFLFLLLLSLGAVFHFLYAVSLGLLTVWLKNVDGMLYFLQTFTGLLAGTVIPLSLLPQQFQWLAWNPFALSVFVPSETLLTGQVSIVTPIVSAAWCIVAFIIFRLIFSKASKAYQAYGG